MNQTTNRNHYVPRGYLARWSDDGKTVWEHKLVVPRPDFPTWERVTLRRAGSRRNLYDAAIPGLQRDHFERWLHRDIETPAYEAIHRLESGQYVSENELTALVRFAFAQDLRTWSAYEVHVAFTEATLPTVLKEAAERALHEHDDQYPLSIQRGVSPPDETPILRSEITAQDDGVLVTTKFIGGPTLWMQRNKRLVSGYASRIAAQKWHIIQPSRGRTWPTSDHPVARYERRDSVFIHGTGWLRAGTEIFMPLTPHYALYAHVGSDAERPAVTTPAETFEFVKLIVGHAHFSVFSDRRDYRWVEWTERRHVDVERFHAAFDRTQRSN